MAFESPILPHFHPMLPQAVSGGTFQNSQCIGALLKSNIEKLDKVCPRLPVPSFSKDVLPQCTPTDAARAMNGIVNGGTCMGITGRLRLDVSTVVIWDWENADSCTTYFF